MHGQIRLPSCRRQVGGRIGLCAVIVELGKWMVFTSAGKEKEKKSNRGIASREAGEKGKGWDEKPHTFHFLQVRWLAVGRLVRGRAMLSVRREWRYRMRSLGLGTLRLCPILPGGTSLVQSGKGGENKKMEA